MKIFKIKNKNGSTKFYFLGIQIFQYKCKISKKEVKLLENIQNEFPTVMSVNETLDLILKGASLCRFGDGEFDIARALKKDDPYQRPSEKLTKRLFEIINIPTNDKLVVCIPPFNDTHNNLKNFYKNISFWQWYWLDRWKHLKSMIKLDKYGNSFVSRDSIFYYEKLEKIKQIWDNREVVFVVGRGSRFVFDERLFNNLKSHEFVYTKPTNAFDEYDELLETCASFDKNKLFFISAGPTATVLAYDLFKLGYQALDLGHLPNCYAQFLGEIISPEHISITKETK